jgi:hypothetical protein
MLNAVPRPGKSAYKCAHCQDYSIILETTDLQPPICPLCKGLLSIDNETTDTPNTLTNQILSFY